MDPEFVTFQDKTYRVSQTRELELTSGVHEYTKFEELEKLTELKTLNLNHNNLKSLPSDITKLTNLKHLWLNYNNLRSLTNIGKLNQLESLGLNMNELHLLTFQTPIFI